MESQGSDHGGWSDRGRGTGWRRTVRQRDGGELGLDRSSNFDGTGLTKLPLPYPPSHSASIRRRAHPRPRPSLEWANAPIDPKIATPDSRPPRRFEDSAAQASSKLECGLTQRGAPRVPGNRDGEGRRARTRGSVTRHHRDVVVTEMAKGSDVSWDGEDEEGTVRGKQRRGEGTERAKGFR